MQQAKETVSTVNHLTCFSKLEMTDEFKVWSESRKIYISQVTGLYKASIQKDLYQINDFPIADGFKYDMKK